MAKKKRKPGGRQPAKRRARPPIENLLDMRSLEGDLQRLVAGRKRPAGGSTPLENAQTIMYRAFEERNEQKRIQLANKALAVCPDCADAYNLLAEHAASRKQARRMYEQGVAAGERALGPEVFRRDAGHFWGILETRPYMRARLGLACGLWSAGRQEEAVEHLHEMLRLNPNDNQGVRYTLAGFLLLLDRDEELAALLAQHDEGTATWAYTKTLLEFRRHGDTPAARQLLAAAKKSNQYVPVYLTGEETPPARQPEYYIPGDETEARQYAGGFLAAWRSTPGAVAWLRANIKKHKDKLPEPKGPAGTGKKRLNEKLRQEHDVWQADFRHMPGWVRIDGEMMRTWVVLVTSLTDELVLGREVGAETPPAALLWDVLAETMRHPAAGTAHRPTELLVRRDERWESLKPHLDEIGVELVETDELVAIDQLFDSLSKHLYGKPRAALLDAPGVTPAQVARYFDAAAYFFDQAPWKRAGDEAAIKIECDKFQSGPWHAAVMGQAGVTIGLALYDDLAMLGRMEAMEPNDAQGGREITGLSVTFGEEWTIPVADLDAARQYGWRVAAPDAYPDVFHKERGLALRPPLAWQLELAEACLRAVPDFVRRHNQDETVREELTVGAATGELKLALSWAGDEE